MGVQVTTYTSADCCIAFSKTNTITHHIGVPQAMASQLWPTLPILLDRQAF